MSTMEEVFDKAMKILSKELSSRELMIFLRAITPKRGDSVKELREKTEDLTLDEVLELVKNAEKKYLK